MPQLIDSAVKQMNCATHASDPRASVSLRESALRKCHGKGAEVARGYAPSFQLSSFARQLSRTECKRGLRVITCQLIALPGQLRKRPNLPACTQAIAATAAALVLPSGNQEKDKGSLHCAATLERDGLIRS
jgi:hypothetical protein